MVVVAHMEVMEGAKVGVLRPMAFMVKFVGKVRS